MKGAVLEGFELVDKIGDGGTGETYLGVHRESGQRAAVKVLSAQSSRDTSVVARFLAEVKTASQVNHIGIADLYACGVHESGRAFVVTELLEGRTLTDALVELGQVSDMESFADIGWQLATLLDAVHAAGLVHGALKPDGIFLTFPPDQGGRALVKLLDFGTARLSLDVRQSQTGSLLGAPLYMSPEASRGVGELDPRADVYSLGCILFEMACGRPPFVREGKGELIIAHATENPPSVASLEPTVPAAIDTLVGRMLTKNPAARPQSMAEVAVVLERFVKRAGNRPAPAAASSGSSPGASAASLPKAAAPLSVPDPPSVLQSGAALPTPQPPPNAGVVQPAARARQDPTALLPPTALEMLAVSASPVQDTWMARVHQSTVLMEPEADDRRGVRQSGRERPRAGRRSGPSSRPARTPAVPHPAGPTRSIVSSVSLPVVILTASIIVVIGTGVLLLRTRKLLPPRNASPPLVEPRRPLVGGHDPAPAALAEPLPNPQLRPPQPAPRPAAPSSWPRDDEAGDPTTPPSDSAVRAKPERRGPAKRW